MGLVTCLTPGSPAPAPGPGRDQDQLPEIPAALPWQICWHVELALVWVDTHQLSSGGEVHTRKPGMCLLQASALLLTPEGHGPAEATSGWSRRQQDVIGF